MATIQNFEDLISWQKARELCLAVGTIIQNEGFKKDWSLQDQINRSSSSTMDNIAEGFDRNSSKEFRQFLFIARSSASEVKSQLYRALDRNYINKTEFEKTYKLADDLKPHWWFFKLLKDKNQRKM